MEALLNGYEDIDAAEILFGSAQDPEDPPPTYNSTFQPPIVAEKFPQPDTANNDAASVLLIAIPEEMQVEPAFDSITSINLERKVLNKIADASAGHDGVYLPFSQVPASDEMVVRRPPLRVIHHDSNSLTVQAAQIRPKVEPGKRKQTFKLVRDDRIVFSHEQLGRLRPKQSIRKNSRNPCFQWASSDEEETEDAVEDASEPNRCPSCKRVFKKLDQHKCKKTNVDMLEPVKQEVDDNSLMLCGCCHKAFKSKKGLVAHMKKCNVKKAAASQIESLVQKRSLRSGVKK